MGIAQPIEQHWFGRPSQVVAPELIGCRLVRRFADGSLRHGMIVEVEAYGPDDPACHAYRKRTPRNAVMFGPPGYSYVYFIYGMYHCFNVVTDLDGIPSAVLIRAIALDVETPAAAADLPKAQAKLGAGPGKLCRVLDIDRTLTEIPLTPLSPLWIEHLKPDLHTAAAQQPLELVQTTRIGITQGVELPWRWYLKGSLAVSKR